MDISQILAVLASALMTAGIFTSRAPASVAPIVRQSSSDGAALIAARADAAIRARTNEPEVRLVSLRLAAWDGCLGIVRPGHACRQIAVGGAVATFGAGGEQFSYHIGAGRWAGPVGAGDGAPLVAPPSNLEPNAEAMLALYARADAALRWAVPAEAVRVEAALPDACGPGDPLPNVRCVGRDRWRASLVVISGSHVSLYAAERDGDRLTLSAPVNAGIATETLQLALRRSLATRLGVPLERVSILSFTRATWPDGCLGIEQAETVCVQALTPGFEAVLFASEPGGDGRQFEYRGSGSSFVPADGGAAGVLLPAVR